MMYILLYLAAGFIFAIIAMGHEMHVKEIDDPRKVYNDFSSEIVFCALAWPLALLIAIGHFSMKFIIDKIVIPYSKGVKKIFDSISEND